MATNTDLAAEPVGLRIGSPARNTRRRRGSLAVAGRVSSLVPFPPVVPRMCCFSKAVESVSNTNIFARGLKNGGQFLVYSMLMKAGEDLAMILPLPTPKGRANASK